MGASEMPPCQDGVVDLPRLQLPSAYFDYAQLDMGAAVFRLGDSEDNVVRGG